MARGPGRGILDARSRWLRARHNWPRSAIRRTTEARSATALDNGVGLEISHTLIEAKLQSQERVLRKRLNDSDAADAVARFRDRLSLADRVEAVRLLEAHAAVSYFAAWKNLAVFWPKADLRRIPSHWCTVGSRHSPLSGGPRLAVTPVHAILNYCFALLESETRLALSALGLDPGLGMGLHTDTPNRDSLALDVLEPVRPQVESWLLDWIACQPLRRVDFFETATGNCRLMSHLCAKLSQTAPVWGKLVAPWAEYVARMLWNTTSRSKSSRLLSTPLTQQHRRQAKGRPPFPTVQAPQPDRICRGCGKQLCRGKRYCLECAATATHENFDEGRKSAQQPASLAKRSAAQRLHRQAIQNWKASDLPAWLTRAVFASRVQPALASIPKARIRSALGVSKPYASAIGAGRRRPHPRHWLALAELAGVMPEVPNRPNAPQPGQ
ncbi:MAG: CRISPR-associated endonuclease Cas1 [Acidobacteriia bacterium]|nr:CRISPR-associated endonuclease Cas1 [Terriglobia bacterium]